MISLTMTKYDKMALEYLTEETSSLKSRRPPRWLRSSRWKPKHVLRKGSDPTIIAVDVLPSGVIPLRLYKEQVVPLLREHQTLRVIVLTLADRLEDHPEVASFCDREGIGLKVLMPGLGLETVVRTDLDPRAREVTLPDEGVFPAAILERARGLKKLKFGKCLDAFVEKLNSLGDDERRIRELVEDTVDQLLQQHPSFRRNIGMFMRLANFERLLRLTSPRASEHVFHSFRVFLAGCAVIDQFYDHFLMAHRRFCIGPEREMCVEYAWLLASLFHDVGRSKEGAIEMVRAQLGDEDLEVRIEGKPTRWERAPYRAALRALGSLAAFVASGKKAESWDGGTVDDEEGVRLGNEWIAIYDKVNTHGIIGALDVLGDIFEKATAANMRRHRPFVVTHAVPASLAILLHDWRIWDSAKRWKLFPVSGSSNPLAALLIYADTWDDHRRRPGASPIRVAEYTVGKEGVGICVEWAKSEDYERELVKYKAFGKALCDLPFKMSIEHGLASPRALGTKPRKK